ncbi:AP-3 complex subunit mu-1 [Portunus trituberculatus]|uniref:AP-3 complex subunit mu-1 n=1 Tax=Portunus trituberculatus TaxID=210409 RepID=A0A5B7CIK7_PORTR|nr:AP-3 complex subunit mu-1 [Portunus trituberculatus]
MFQVEGVVLEIPMPKCVLNCNLTVTQGKYTFDPVSKLLNWNIGRIDPTKLPNMRGNISVQSGSPPPESNPIINVRCLIIYKFKIVFYMFSLISFIIWKLIHYYHFHNLLYSTS